MVRARIRTVLIPAEGGKRLYNAVRKLYQMILIVRNEKYWAKRIEKYKAALEANSLVDDIFSITRYSIYKNITTHLEQMSNLVKKDPQYLGIAVQSSALIRKYFEDSRKSEYQSMRRCNFLRKESKHLRNEARRVERRLRSTMRKQVGALQKKQQEALKQLKTAQAKQKKAVSGKIIKGQFMPSAKGKRGRRAA